jgi:hypothetical protein
MLKDCEVREMRTAVTVLGIIRERAKSAMQLSTPDGLGDRQSRHETLESRITGNGYVRFGGGRLEKCHNGNSLAAYPTL